MIIEVLRDQLRSGSWAQVRMETQRLLRDNAGVDVPGLFALLARVQCRLGCPEEALEAAQRAVDLRADWESELALGEAWVAMGEAPQAHGLLRTVLDGLRAEQSPDPRAVMELRLALATACRAAGLPEEGVGYGTQAVADAQETFGDHAPEMAQALYILGICLYSSGQLTGASNALQNALEIRSEARPPHPEAAACLDGLGIVARASNRASDAVEAHREALEIWTARLGEDAGPIGASRHALAQALHRTGDFPGARDEMSRALLITIRTLGSDHVDTWITRFELGRFEVDCGEVEEGFQRMGTARAEVSDRLGSDHPVVRAMDRWL